MQFSTVFAITIFLTATFANKLYPNETDSVSSKVKESVHQTIDDWLNDIKTVNNFVDTTKANESLKDISAAASKAFKAAQNEGTSNTALKKDVNLGDAGNSASQALLAEFDIIGSFINDTIFNPGNLKKNLDAINGARCPPPVGSGAISLEGDVQGAAASAVGIKINAPAIPTACNPAYNYTN